MNFLYAISWKPLMERRAGLDVSMDRLANSFKIVNFFYMENVHHHFSESIYKMMQNYPNCPCQMEQNLSYIVIFVNPETFINFLLILKKLRNSGGNFRPFFIFFWLWTLIVESMFYKLVHVVLERHNPGKK